MPRASQKMHNEKSRLGKKGRLSIISISVFIMIFSFISIIYIFSSIFLFATANDFLFFNMQNLTEELENQNIVKEGTAALTQTFGDDFTNFELHLDDLWLIAYILFIISSLVVCYKADRQNYYSFLGWLFYGIMFFLFVLTLFSTITDWFKDELLLTILPNVALVIPKFFFFLDNIGIFSGIHLIVCLLVNMVDFDFAKIFQKKKLEQKALEDNEVI